MDLAQAVGKHAEWKVKLRKAMITGEPLDAATIGTDNCCELGKWLHGEGRTKFGTRPAFPVCVSRHAAFHVEAGKVARAINAKRLVEAEAALESEAGYGTASSALGAALMNLKRECGL
ncbi:MAG TPA: CZB domain-containing protein [Gemmata sp.]